jgi:hypothetical protein
VRRGWLRANRWWLLVLPVALVLAAAASSYRVRTFWYDDGFHHRTATAKPGGFVRVVNHFEDGVGKTERTFRVRASGLTELNQVPDSLEETGKPVPRGTTAYGVDLELEAAPDQDLNYCRVVLVDRDGRKFGGLDTDLFGQANMCVPEDTPGPNTPLSKGEKRGVLEEGEDPRPPSWSVEPVVLVPRGADIREVRISFTPPEYVGLPLPR